MSMIQVIVGAVDLTYLHDGLVFSNTDPGGYEALTLSTHRVQGVYPGARVTVRNGTDWAWYGRVTEIGQESANGRTTFVISAVGFCAELTDGVMQEIYVDLDINNWTKPISRARQLSRAGGGVYGAEGTVTVVPDPISGNPTLMISQSRIVNTAAQFYVTETWYDSAGIDIETIYYSATTYDLGAGGGALSAPWAAIIYASTDDIASTTTDSGSLIAGSTGNFTAPSNARFAFAHMFIPATITADGDWRFLIKELGVYGTHGLTWAAGSPPGLYPRDIARDAFLRAGITALVIPADTSYVAPHVVYRDPVSHERVIDDMANLMGSHWGVWEPRGILDDTPVGYFIARPTEPTCSISMSDCEEIDAPTLRLDQLYDTAVVAYRDAAGSSGRATVTLANPLLAQAGVGSRTLTLDMGVGDEASAEEFGEAALALAQASARGGGWATLPSTVHSATGRELPACLLKAGRDRIRINDLPDSGPLTELDSRRFDTFRIKRVETTVDEHGVPKTRVDFDGGADLLDVLTARLTAGQFGSAGSSTYSPPGPGMPTPR